MSESTNTWVPYQANAARTAYRTNSGTYRAVTGDAEEVARAHRRSDQYAAAATTDAVMPDGVPIGFGIMLVVFLAGTVLAWAAISRVGVHAPGVWAIIPGVAVALLYVWAVNTLKGRHDQRTGWQTRYICDLPRGLAADLTVQDRNGLAAARDEGEDVLDEAVALLSERYAEAMKAEMGRVATEKREAARRERRERTKYRARATELLDQAREKGRA